MENTPIQIRDSLIRGGANKDYATRLVRHNYNYVERIYKESTIAQKADVMRTLGFN